MCRDAINRFLRGLGLNWKVFNIFDIWHPTGGRNAIWAEKMHFFVENFQTGVPMCAHTFWWGAWPKKGRKGHTFVGKVVRPRSDTWFSKKSILSEPKMDCDTFELNFDVRCKVESLVHRLAGISALYDKKRLSYAHSKLLTMVSKLGKTQARGACLTKKQQKM